MTAFKIYSLRNFQIYNAVQLTIVTRCTEVLLQFPQGRQNQGLPLRMKRAEEGFFELTGEEPNSVQEAGEWLKQEQMVKLPDNPEGFLRLMIINMKCDESLVLIF